MNILIICVIIFILILGSGCAGLMVQKRLVDEHKTAESRGVVGQVSGLVSLLLALVLGTLVGVSFSFFSNQKTQLEAFAAQFCGLIRRSRNTGRRPSPRGTSSRMRLSPAMRRFGAGESRTTTR